MKGNQQAFSTIEFKQRIRNVQAKMAFYALDVLFIHSPENIYYLTGHQTSGYFAYQVLLLPREGEPRLLLRYLEKGNVDEYSWMVNPDTWKEGDDLVQRTIEVFNEMGGKPKKIGLEKACWFLTATVCEQISAALSNLEIVDSSLLVDHVRVIKSEAEIKYLRQAGAIAEVEMRAAIDAMSHGVTEANIAAAVYEAGIQAGCEYTGLPHHIMSGHRYNVCHANWSPKIIKRGELVLLELYGCMERYHSTQMRTVSIGEPSDAVKRAVEIVTAAQDAGLSKMKAGASSLELDTTVRGAIKKIRPDYFNRTGYSTGIGFPPRTAEWEALDFNESDDWELKAGMVFHMLALAGGFGISETVVVTQTGIERLTPSSPRELIIR